MNIHVPDRSPEPVPRLFDVAEIARMAEAGILGEDERIELIDGELVRMAATKFVHQHLHMELARFLGRALERDFYVSIAGTLQLGPSRLVEPDILVARKASCGISPAGYLEIPAPEILLLIEISDATLAYDLGRKAALYAAYGVADYWVVEAGTRITRVHREPGREGYRSVVEVGPDDVLRPLCPDLDMIALHLGSVV